MRSLTVPRSTPTVELIIVKAVECLHDMYRTGSGARSVALQPRPQDHASGGIHDKMYRMVVDICKKEGAKINGNTFELVIEALLEIDQWKEAPPR